VSVPWTLGAKGAERLACGKWIYSKEKDDMNKKGSRHFCKKPHSWVNRPYMGKRQTAQKIADSLYRREKPTRLQFSHDETTPEAVDQEEHNADVENDTAQRSTDNERENDRVCGQPPAVGVTTWTDNCPSQYLCQQNFARIILCEKDPS
jgi:hypothetical protein